MPGVNRPRVLITADAVGGVWRYAIELARGFAASDIDSVIAVLGPTPSAAQATEARGVVPLIETALPLDWTAPDEATLRQAAAALGRLAHRVGTDLVHLHAPAFAAWHDFAAPVVSVAHSCLATWWSAVRNTPPPDEFRWRIAATGRGLLASDAVIAPTAAFADALRDAYGPCDIAVVHNGCRPMQVAGEPRRRREILTGGRLWDAGKNIAVLDRIAPRVAAPILAAGPTEGPNGATVELDRLTLLGTLDAAALRHHYASASIYAAPARYEPFGLGVLEAAQAGMALVLSDIASFRELWDGAAVFVGTEDEAGWVRVLSGMIDDPAAVAAHGARARERSGRYTEVAMARDTAAVHRTVQRAASPAPAA